MRANTRIVIDIETGVVLERESLEYSGPIALACGGPSAQQTQIAQSQQAFFNTMTQSYSQMFAGETNILNSLTTAMQPILNAGINQYGFSAAEDTALRTQATQGTASNYAAANKALGEQTAAQGGGNAFLPSGANAQLQGQVNAAGAAQQSAQQLGITTAGYEQGRQNYLSAAQSLGSTAGLMNPTGYAGAANSAGNSAFSSATTNYQENGSAWGAIGGLLGGAAGAFLGPVGASLGSSLGSSLGGMFGGGGSSGGGGGGGGISSYDPGGF